MSRTTVAMALRAPLICARRWGPHATGTVGLELALVWPRVTIIPSAVSQVWTFSFPPKRSPHGRASRLRVNGDLAKIGDAQPLSKLCIRAGIHLYLLTERPYPPPWSLPRRGLGNPVRHPDVQCT